MFGQTFSQSLRLPARPKRKRTAEDAPLAVCGRAVIIATPLHYHGNGFQSGRAGNAGTFSSPHTFLIDLPKTRLKRNTTLLALGIADLLQVAREQGSACDKAR